MKKDPSVYIRHIHDCILRIDDYVDQGRAAFFQDHKTQDAVIRNLEVIGQAVKDIGSDRLSQHVGNQSAREATPKFSYSNPRVNQVL